MTAIERINQLSHRIFNTSKSEQQTSRTSNPFAASNFQKNILTEDVFESSKSKQADKISFTGKLSASSKRIYSTFVGSINDFGSRFYEGIESVKAYCSKAKEVLSRDITSFFINSHDREIAKMSKMDPHSEVKPMFREALSALESDMVQAA